MTRINRRPAVRRTISATVLAAATLGMAGCADIPEAVGPAVVSVTKAPIKDSVPQTVLTEFDPDNTPGASAVALDGLPDDLWLPVAVSMTPPIGDPEGNGTGSFYLEVQATYKLTSKTLAARNPVLETTELETPKGTVLTGVIGDQTVQVTITPGSEETGTSVVLVSWEPTGNQS